jgi:hypothetical protein
MNERAPDAAVSTANVLRRPITTPCDGVAAATWVTGVGASSPEVPGVGVGIPAGERRGLGGEHAQRGVPLRAALLAPGGLAARRAGRGCAGCGAREELRVPKGQRGCRPRRRGCCARGIDAHARLARWLRLRRRPLGASTTRWVLRATPSHDGGQQGHARAHAPDRVLPSQRPARLAPQPAATIADQGMVASAWFWWPGPFRNVATGGQCRAPGTQPPKAKRGHSTGA